jgi:hypothetical protein
MMPDEICRVCYGLATIVTYKKVPSPQLFGEVIEARCAEHMTDKQRRDLEDQRIQEELNSDV